jgi:hypothetical protein
MIIERSIINVFMIEMSCLSICIIIEVQKTIFLSKFPQKAEMQGADLTTISINYTFIFVLEKPKAGGRGRQPPDYYQGHCGGAGGSRIYHLSIHFLVA